MIDTFPSLETPRLLLRAPADDDLDFVFRHFSDPEVHRWLLDEKPVATREQAQEIVDSYSSPAGKSHNRWLLILRDEGRPVGTCGFHAWSRAHRRAEIGYDLEPASWGKGLMREALEAALDFGFGAMELHRVAAIVHPGNEASLRLLDRLGFRQEALLREHYYDGERYHDHCLLTLLAPEWR